MKRARRYGMSWMILALGLALFCPPGAGQAPPAPAPESLVAFSFRSSPLEMLVNLYGELAGRTLIPAQGIDLKKQFTAYNPKTLRLTKAEAMAAIESILAMHNVALVPVGERYLKIVQIGAARQEGLGLQLVMPEAGLPDTDQLVSQLVQLQHIDTGEAHTAIAGFIHSYGKIHKLDRTNSLLITDTSVNLKRILEIIEYLDQPVERKVRTFVIQIKHSKAGEIAGKLKQLIEELQDEKEKKKTPTVVARPTTPAGVIRAKRTLSSAQVPTPAGSTPADREILIGKVKIVPDDRTNILIVITRQENMEFIETIVKALDKDVAPDLTVEVFFLEYAEAGEVAGLLSSLIGGKSTTPAPAAGEKKEGASGEDARTRALREYAQQTRKPAETSASALQTVTIGELSQSVKIISDKRTNSLLISGSAADLAILKGIIAKVDVMLAQVLIEAVIMEIGLDDDVTYGVDWLQRSMIAFENENGVKEGKFAFAGGSRQGSGSPRDARNMRDISQVSDAVSGLTYYFTLFDYPIDLVLRVIASDSKVRVLSTPIVMTSDNKEATIKVGEERPVVTSTSSEYNTTVRSTYEYKLIGIDLSVTPHINTNGFVVMDVQQSIDNVAGVVSIDGNDVPIITKRNFKASIAVNSRSTVVLGGLVSQDQTKSRSKIPFLGDIPLLGMLFRQDSKSQRRREVLVLITPYVLRTDEEAETETARRKETLNMAEGMWQRGWSQSRLASPPEERAWFLKRWWRRHLARRHGS